MTTSLMIYMNWSLVLGRKDHFVDSLKVFTDLRG